MRQRTDVRHLKVGDLHYITDLYEDHADVRCAEADYEIVGKINAVDRVLKANVRGVELEVRKIARVFWSRVEVAIRTIRVGASTKDLDETVVKVATFLIKIHTQLRPKDLIPTKGLIVLGGGKKGKD